MIGFLGLFGLVGWQHSSCTSQITQRWATTHSPSSRPSSSPLPSSCINASECWELLRDSKRSVRLFLLLSFSFFPSVPSASCCGLDWIDSVFGCFCSVAASLYGAAPQPGASAEDRGRQLGQLNSTVILPRIVRRAAEIWRIMKERISINATVCTSLPPLPSSLLPLPFLFLSLEFSVCSCSFFLRVCVLLDGAAW